MADFPERSHEPAADPASAPSRPGPLERRRLARSLRERRRVRDDMLLELGALVFELHRQGRRAPDLLQARAAELDAVDHDVRALEATLAGEAVESDGTTAEWEQSGAQDEAWSETGDWEPAVEPEQEWADTGEWEPGATGEWEPAGEADHVDPGNWDDTPEWADAEQEAPEVDTPQPPEEDGRAAPGGSEQPDEAGDPDARAGEGSP